jgi:hypothetical protein
LAVLFPQRANFLRHLPQPAFVRCDFALRVTQNEKRLLQVLAPGLALCHLEVEWNVAKIITEGYESTARRLLY